MATEITCSKCGHPVTVVDGGRIICPNCKETEAAKALFAAPTRPSEVVAVENDSEPRITFVCPFCSETYPVSEDLAGKKMTCRNCYEASRAPGKEKKPKVTEDSTAPGHAVPERKPSTNEPWFYAFADQLANVGMIVGGGACVAGFLVALSFFKGRDTPGALAIALGFLAGFFLVVGGMAGIRVLVHAMRLVAARQRDGKKEDVS